MNMSEYDELLPDVVQKYESSPELFSSKSVFRSEFNQDDSGRICDGRSAACGVEIDWGGETAGGFSGASIATVLDIVANRLAYLAENSEALSRGHRKDQVLDLVDKVSAATKKARKLGL